MDSQDSLTAEQFEQLVWEGLLLRALVTKVGQGPVTTRIQIYSSIRRYSNEDGFEASYEQVEPLAWLPGFRGVRYESLGYAKPVRLWRFQTLLDRWRQEDPLWTAANPLVACHRQISNGEVVVYETIPTHDVRLLQHCARFHTRLAYEPNERTNVSHFGSCFGDCRFLLVRRLGDHIHAMNKVWDGLQPQP